MPPSQTKQFVGPPYKHFQFEGFVVLSEQVTLLIKI